MGMFNTRKPRRFTPVHIYTDERRERLDKLVSDVRRSQGECAQEDKPYDPTKFRGKFGQYVPRAQRYRESAHRLGWPLAIVLIAVLLLVWRILLTGKTY